MRYLQMLAIILAAPFAARAAEEAAKPSQGPYVLIIGIGETADPTIEKRPTAEADARNLYDLFAEKKYFEIAPERLVLLTASPDDTRKSEKATKENIIKAVHDAVAKTGKDDTLIIAFFGRGASSGERTCIFAADSTFKDRAKNGLLGNDLEADLKLAKSQKLAIFFDIHFKGYDAGKETLVEPNLRDVLESVYGSEEKGEAPPPHDKLMVFSSRPADDPLSVDGQGLFTKTIIEALKGKADIEGYEADGIVTVDELAKYLEKEIPNQARKLGKTVKEKEAVPFIIGEEFSHFPITKNPDKTAEVEKRLAALAALEKAGTIDADTAKAGKGLLNRMPKLKNSQEMRKGFQALADGKLGAVDFDKAYKALKQNTVLSTDDAEAFAKKIVSAMDIVQDRFVKVSNPGELAVAGVKGLYRRLEEPVPAEIEAKFKSAKELTSPERRQLLVDARLKLGKREDLENNKDADIGITMMLASLNDPYTTYYDKEMIKKTESQLRGEFRGVGIQIRRDLVKDALLVVSPIKDSPAYLAGIQAGDHIVGIKRDSNPEGEPLKPGEAKEFSTAGMKTEDAIDIILGKVGIPITLVIERNGEKKDYVLKRGRVSVETVLGVKRDEKDNWEFIIDPKDKIAYIQLTQFAPQTTAQLATLLRKLDEQGVKGLVLDLRFNPGGVLNGAATICSMFVEDGKVVTVRPRVGREESLNTRTFAAPACYTKFPIAVLINGSSASASEIVSACLQDYGRAIIVGERSYGKGSVQQLQPFRPTEGEVKLTTARYFPPSDKNIDKNSADPAKPDEWGVKPDKGFELKLSKEDFRELFDHFREREIILAKDKPAKPDPEKPAKVFKDTQLEKALDYVRDQLKAVANEKK